MRTGQIPLRGNAATAALALFASVAALVAPTSAVAQETDTGAAVARTVVVKRLMFFSSQDLSFGAILPSATAGVVRVAPDGTRTKTGGVTLVGSSQKPAEFAGMGFYNERVRIRLGSNTIQLTGPGASMTVSQFEIGSTPTTVLTTSYQVFRLGSSTGIFNFPVGARLNVNANQAPGIYRGTFSITLDYM